MLGKIMNLPNNKIYSMLVVLIIQSFFSFAFAENNDNSRIEFIPTTITEMELSTLDNAKQDSGITLTGVIPTSDLYFSIRKDEIITEAFLDLNFTPSPSLLPIRSQLNVYLNGILQEVIPIEESQLGKQTNKQIKLNPLIIKDYNNLYLEFLGHYSDYCENRVNSTIWLNIAKNSLLTLKKQRLQVVNNLAFFPIPFINSSTKESTRLAIVLPKNPNAEIIRAASIFASYGGKIVQWRGIDYPVYYDDLPIDGHAIVFATNDIRPSFLKDYPKVDGPQIEMMDLPNFQNGKMLVISAPNTQGLITAVQSLAQGNILFNGPISKIVDFKQLEERKPYDAPNWINIDHKTTFGSLVEYEGQLNKTGLAPDIININLRLPPDLYFAQGSRINIDLAYKYSKPSPIGVSQMQFLFNNHLVRSYVLDSTKEQGSIIENLPILGFIDMFSKAKVETLLLSHTNQMSFDFQYNLVLSSKKDECTTQTLINNRVEIDPESTIDFTDLYHFAKMPNLELFWENGYPFSIYADLKDTTVVIDNENDSNQLSALFNTLSRISAEIGYTALNVDIQLKNKNFDVSKLKNKDILVIGSLPKEFIADSNALAVMEANEQSLHYFDNPYNKIKITREQDAGILLDTKQDNSEGLSSIVSFQSPFNSNKTIVALLADSPNGMANLSAHMVLNKLPGHAMSSITVFRENDSHSFEAGKTYYVGNLPWYQRIWYFLLQSPWILIFSSLISMMVFCYLIYLLLNKIKNSRLTKFNGRQ